MTFADKLCMFVYPLVVAGAFASSDDKLSVLQAAFFAYGFGIMIGKWLYKP